MATSLAVVIGSRSIERHDPDAELDPLGHGGHRGERHERVEHVAVLARQLAAAGVGRVAADRDVGVLGEEERVEPALLGQAPEPNRVDRVLGDERAEPDVHQPPPQRIGRWSSP